MQKQKTISNYFLSSDNSTSSRKRSAQKNVKIADDISTPIKIPKNSDLESLTSAKKFLSTTTEKRLKTFSFNKLKAPSQLLEHIKEPEYENEARYQGSQEMSSSLVFHDCVVNDDESKEIQIDDKTASSTSDESFNRDVKYTPLENQYFEFKSEYPGVLLLIECGYKYRFFGEDAKIASKELNVACYKNHNLLSAIIPAHRWHIHVQRLVAKNFKVGVIKQTESAALKAIGSNKNSLFCRKLYAIYTKSTLIGDEFSVHSEEESVDVGSGFLACIYEEELKESKKHLSNIAVLGVQPISGDVFYSSFVDTLHKPELEAVLLRLNPTEIIYPKSGLSSETKHLLNFALTHGSKQLRLEQLENNIFDYAFAINKVSAFYESRSSVDELEQQTDVLQRVLSLPPLIICCLSALIVYLSDFKLEIFLKDLNNIKPLSKLSEHLTLNAAALRSLEIFGNATTYSEYGSLLWVLNKTLTKFGERLLKLWISRPLKKIKKIEERLDVVTEITQSESLVFRILEKSLSNMPDIEKMLCSAFYHRCSCSELFTLIQSLMSLKNELHNISSMVEAEVTAPRLKKLFFETLSLLRDVETFSLNINEKAAREENKQNFFKDTTMYIAVENCKEHIRDTEHKLNDLKIGICKTLRLPAFKYSTVSGQKYLIEIPNSLVPLVPIDWTKMSGTKQFSRFRSPAVTQLHNELEQQKASLIEACDVAWHLFLDMLRGA